MHNWPVWWHYMSVSIPDTVLYPNHAAIYISSGSNDNRCADRFYCAVYRTDYSLSAKYVRTYVQ